MSISTKIIAKDHYSTPSYPKPLRVWVKDKYNNPLGSEVVKITINSVTYSKYTNEYGMAELNINLPLGTYQCDLLFEGFDAYEGCTKTITVYVVEKYPVTILADNLTKNYTESGQVKAKVNVYDGSALSYYHILFQINGVNYTRRTDGNGEASLNIKLPRGEYACKIISPMDDYFDYAEKTVIVKVISSTHMDGTNISKMEDETAVYQCAVYDELGRVDCTVTITVNGVTYTRHTEADGLAKLNIRLPKGEYDIIAKFDGDSSHTGSQVVNHISSKPYMEELTRNVNGAWIPGDNTGFMESHIQVKQWSPEVVEHFGGVVFWDDTGQTFHKDIPFTSYEITETDPRVKTAKFTTNKYFDLTAGQLWVHISSPYHENFGGKILKVEFNKDNGLYTYQCQDGRRNYMSKYRMINVNTRVYDLLREFLALPLDSFDGTLEGLNNLGERGRKLLSGLRPIEAYNIQNGVLKQNWYDQQATEELSYDSTIDKIMNYAHVGGCPTDVYFSPEGVCQIEPLDVNTWLKTGFKLTHSDLTSYNYGFDTTNILTGVNFQTIDNTPIVNPDTGQTINEELSKLGFYFGANIGMISPVTESVTTEVTTNSTGGGTGTGVNNKGKTVVVACDTNSELDGEVLGKTCATLEANGYDVINLGIGPGQFSAYDYYGASSGKVGVYLMAGSIVSIADAIDGSGNFDYYVFGLRGDLGLRSTTEFDTKPWGADDDCTPICDRWVGHTGAEIAQMARDSGRGDVVVGNTPQEIANAVLSAVNGESGGGGGTSTTTTQQINVAETYKKAQDEVVKSGRDLLNFEVNIPLNHTMFKNLHTNQMFFTELPKDFKLGNLAELFKILPTYKINRGLGTEYQENRWYIEKQVIKCDSNGLFSTLTLNVLPSPYSVYTEKLRSYRDAYDQAFKQQENKGGSSSGGVGNARLGDDSTDTNSMACATGRYPGNAGDNENFDDCAKKGYAQEGREYYNWARTFNSPIELARAINDRIEYSYYYDNQHANAEDTFQRGYANCYDGCRLTKCCFDAAGFDCIVVTGHAYGYGHGWNAIKHNGRWYTFDIAFDVTGSNWAGTNSIRMADEW